jgi:hypothetical protein
MQKGLTFPGKADSLGSLIETFKLLRDASAIGAERRQHRDTLPVGGRFF